MNKNEQKKLTWICSYMLFLHFILQLPSSWNTSHLCSALNLRTWVHFNMQKTKQWKRCFSLMSFQMKIFHFISLVLAESSLLLRVLHYLLLHVESFATPHGIHVLEGLVFRVCFLTKVQIFFLRGGNPVRIATDCLQDRPDKWNIVILGSIANIFKSLPSRHSSVAHLQNV